MCYTNTTKSLKSTGGHKMNSLEKLFNTKLTENGDVAYKSTGNNLLDILFMTEYFSKNLNEVSIGNSPEEQLFAMFIRDPRYGLGRRDLGRVLMRQAEVPMSKIVKAGRYDDLYKMPDIDYAKVIRFLWKKVKEGDELAKKWMPRFNTQDDAVAKLFCKLLGIPQKEYRKTIKTDTVENLMSTHRDKRIKYEHVPSLALIKYYKRFAKDPRFQEYIQQVKRGEKKLNISCTNVYDIYRNRDKVDADLFFDKLEKIKINCIPILDTSGSMEDGNDSIGKAMSIAYYLAKCSTYCPNQVVSFSKYPQLIKIHETVQSNSRWPYYKADYKFETANKFSREINSMYTGDCTNTDFGAVIKLLSKLEEYPEYFVVLSDMEFDMGSSMSKDKVMKLFKDKGIKTKIIWWNFNNRHKTVPEIDEYGNIFLSGYNPMLLKYLEAEFDGQKFLKILLEEYKKNFEKDR